MKIRIIHLGLNIGFRGKVQGWSGNSAMNPLQGLGPRRICYKSFGLILYCFFLGGYRIIFLSSISISNAQLSTCWATFHILDVCLLKIRNFRRPSAVVSVFLFWQRWKCFAKIIESLHAIPHSGKISCFFPENKLCLLHNLSLKIKTHYWKNWEIMKKNIWYDGTNRFRAETRWFSFILEVEGYFIYWSESYCLFIYHKSFKLPSLKLEKISLVG